MAPLFVPVKGSVLAGLATGACLLAWFYLDHASLPRPQATRRKTTVTVRRTARAVLARWVMVTAMLAFQLALLPNPFAMMFWTLVFCSKRRPTETEGASVPVRLMLGILPLVCVICLSVPIYKVFIGTALAPGATLWWHYAIGVAGIALAHAADPLARRMYPAAASDQAQSSVASDSTVVKAAGGLILAREAASDGQKAIPRRRRAAKRRNRI